jgi:hypothetical protein
LHTVIGRMLAGAHLQELDQASKAALLLSEEALIAANINPATGLATDYLNHFNEITMLIGLVADMPEVIDEVLLWRPASYVEHFARSAFKGKALAIAAYHASPAATRAALSGAVGALDAALLAAIVHLSAAHPDDRAEIVAAIEAAVRPLMARASAVINGMERDPDLFASEPVQVSVDALLV